MATRDPAAEIAAKPELQLPESQSFLAQGRGPHRALFGRLRPTSAVRGVQGDSLGGSTGCEELRCGFRGLHVPRWSPHPWTQ